MTSQFQVESKSVFLDPLNHQTMQMQTTFSMFSLIRANLVYSLWSLVWDEEEFYQENFYFNILLF